MGARGRGDVGTQGSGDAGWGRGDTGRGRRDAQEDAPRDGTICQRPPSLITVRNRPSAASWGLWKPGSAPRRGQEGAPGSVRCLLVRQGGDRDPRGASLVLRPPRAGRAASGPGGRPPATQPRSWARRGEGTGACVVGSCKETPPASSAPGWIWGTRPLWARMRPPGDLFLLWAAHGTAVPMSSGAPGAGW